MTRVTWLKSTWAYLLLSSAKIKSLGTLNEGHEDPPSLQSRARQLTSNESYVIWVCDMTQYASRKANPPKPRKSHARVMYDMTHSHNTEWVICDMNVWHDSTYIPKAQPAKVSRVSRVTCRIHIELRLYTSRKPNPPKLRISCTWVMCMRKGVYVSQKPNLKLLDYMYCESLTWSRLTLYVPKGQSSKVSNVMYMSHKVSKVTFICTDWFPTPSHTNGVPTPFCI